MLLSGKLLASRCLWQPGSSPDCIAGLRRRRCPGRKNLIHLALCELHHWLQDTMAASLWNPHPLCTLKLCSISFRTSHLQILFLLCFSSCTAGFRGRCCASLRASLHLGTSWQAGAAGVRCGKPAYPSLPGTSHCWDISWQRKAAWCLGASFTVTLETLPPPPPLWA